MKFNADDHTDRFAPISGQHRFRIESVTNDFTKSNGDPLLAFELKLVDLGRTHWERFIVEHSNPKTVEIALGKLSSLSRAVGHPRWDNEQELVGLIGEAVFGPQKDNADFAEIKKYIVPGESKGATTAYPPKANKGGSVSVPASQAPHPADLDDDGIGW